MSISPGLSVTVRLSGPLAQRLGSRPTVQLPAGATVATLIAEIAGLAGLAGGEARALAAVSGGAYLARDQPLADGQRVDVLVPVAGG
jgi:molybdopterin converting factor small subunit